MKVLVAMLFLLTSFSFGADCVRKKEGVVICQKAGKMWQDNEQISRKVKFMHTWYEAKKFCKNLTLAGFYDWRLPSEDELKQMKNPTTKRHPYFKYMQYGGHYWTNKTKFFDRDRANSVSTVDGTTRWIAKRLKADVRCVRDL